MASHNSWTFSGNLGSEPESRTVSGKTTKTTRAKGNSSKPTDKGHHAGRTPANKGQKLPVELLTQDEVRGLLAACGARSVTGVRNRALVAVFAGAGLRLAEALALMPRDVDLEAGTLTVREGKGRKRRVTSLTVEASAVLARWIDRRAALGMTGRQPVFCTTSENSTGKPLSQGYVRTLLPRLATRAGIEKRVHPHGLRHFYAVQHRRSGTDIGHVSRLLGHSSIATTARYLDHIDPMEALGAGRKLEAW